MTFTRRMLIAAAAAFSISSLTSANVAVAKTVDFTQAKFEQYLKGGKPFMLGVHTSWCSTCATQKRVISGLRKQDAAYKNLTVMEMDWDEYRGSAIGKKLRIPRRSTLIMYTKGKEVGRILSGTSPKSIKGLIDKAL